jgi:ABC-type Fe2+-enterobactin transport system substrate-binding protein
MLRRGLRAALVVLLAVSGVAARQDTLVERTVAVVGGTAITLSDVQTALALGLIEAVGPDADAEGVVRLVERWLILHEVSRFAPPEPAQSDVDARLAAVSARAGSPEALAALLTRGGFTPGRLAAWVRDDLRIAAYLDQRFATAGVASEADVAEYASAHAADLDAAGVPAADRPRVARERLQAERRRELITDWLAELRRRTPVIKIKN